MAYTILKSDGTVLTTIADGTINTTSTPLGLVGRNYAGYGQVLDTNFTHMLENFAYSNPPSNPLQGQLWFDTTSDTLKICPTDGEVVAANWYTISSTNANGLVVFNTVTVTGNLIANNANITNQFTAGDANVVNITVSGNANITTANVTGTLTTTSITTGGSLITGTIDGSWSFLSKANLGPVGNVTITGGSSNQFLQTNGSGVLTWATPTTSILSNGSSNVSIPVINGNVLISAQNAANVVVISGLGANVTGTLDVSGNVTATTNLRVIGNLRATTLTTGAAVTAGNITGNWTMTPGSQLNLSSFTATNANIGNTTTRVITTGGVSTTGNITGNWTLTAGSRFNATYADVAERFASEEVLDAGTVVELGGSKEIRKVKYELSEDVFGVISDTAAYLLNSAAGTDETHPPVAMSGRVKVKVVGLVNKGQRLVSAGDGYARASKEGEATAFNTIGRALEDKTSIKPGFVEAIVIIR